LVNSVQPDLDFSGFFVGKSKQMLTTKSYLMSPRVICD